LVKIYGTLGPACRDENTLYEMFKNGMTGMRINLSHTTLISEKDNIENVINAAKKAGVIPELLMDMQGPELRIGVLDNPVELKTSEQINVSVLKLPDVVKPFLKKGQELLLDDGKILAEMLSEDTALIIRGGVLTSRKSVALPNTKIDTPALTQSDIDNISAAKEVGITGLMQPFVRSVEDLNAVRNALKEYGCEHIQIFAKIENLEGVESIGTLIPGCDEIVIARGDLGNAVPLWDLPGVQKKLSKECRTANRRFMVVTQMLASMEHNSVPTRAEVSDIFNAVVDGASSVMVTGETAAGDYPVETIKYMVKTVKSAQKYLAENNV